MRLPILATASLLVLLPLRTPAADSAWRSMPLPPEAQQLNHTAENAASTETAARLYAQSVRLFPSNGPALYGLGRALLDQNRPIESLTIFRRLNFLFPNDPEILAALATALAHLPALTRADVQAGLAFAEQSIQLQPNAPATWHLLSVFHLLAGNYASAADCARQAVTLAAQNPIDPETTALYQQQETACTEALLVFSPLD